MINIIYKKLGLKINAIWFCDDTSEVLYNNKSDIVFFHGIKKTNLKNNLNNLQRTLITNLHESLEEIFNKFNKNYKYEINRSIKEDIKCVMYDSKTLKENPCLVENFKKEYDEFVKAKGIKNTYNNYAINKYLDYNNIILTKAFKNEQVYAQHIYVCDDINVRLLYSVSNFRIEGSDRNLVGRANKYLHWEEIKYFKEKGFMYLDWGGISSFTNPNGVDIFKMGFAGQEKEHHNVIIGNSFVGKIIILFKKLKRF